MVYTATFRDETLPQILELLKISAPVKYSITDRERLPDNSYAKRKIVITKKNMNAYGETKKLDQMMTIKGMRQHPLGNHNPFSSLDDRKVSNLI